MHYYIDGYNLFFQLGFTEGPFQNQRDKLIETINKKVNALKLSCTIVFDAAFTPGESTRSHFESLEVVFTSQGQTADQWILEELPNKKNNRQFIVVTGDKLLARQARQLCAGTQSIQEFISILDSRYNNLKHPKRTKKEHLKSVEIPQIPPKEVEVAEKVIEGSNEYYLKVFEERAKEELSKKQRTTSQKTAKTRKIRPPPADPIRDEASEMERWLRLFENHLKKDH